jgi:hypothetical protein
MIPNEFELTDSRSGLSRKANYKTQGIFLTTEPAVIVPDTAIKDLDATQFDLDLKNYIYIKSEFVPFDKVNKLERRVYQLLDFVGDIGGFFDAIKIIVEFVLSFYTGQFFMVSFVKNLFKIDLT